MSPQLEFLKNTITSAQAGNAGAVTLLRQICRLAADEAPPPDLLALARCLHQIGVDAARTELGRN